MTVQSYMPAFLEGKKAGMDVLANAIIGELNAYADSHKDEAPPESKLYNRLVELCGLARKGTPPKVYAVIDNAFQTRGIYSAEPLAEAAKESSTDVVSEIEVKD